MVKRKGLAKGTGKGYKNLLPKDPRVHKDSGKGIKQPQKIPHISQPKQKFEFARDSKGKISKTVLSDYGKHQLRVLDGVTLYFTDIGEVDLEGNKLIIRETKEIFDIIDSDRKVNQIIFRTI